VIKPRVEASYASTPLALLRFIMAQFVEARWVTRKSRLDVGVPSTTGFVVGKAISRCPSRQEA
jgi:hypothetical protein